MTIFYGSVKYQSYSSLKFISLVISFIEGCVGDSESFPGILSFVPTQGLLLVFVLQFPVHAM